jgi:hypothetical protein
MGVVVMQGMVLLEAAVVVVVVVVVIIFPTMLTYTHTRTHTHMHTHTHSHTRTSPVAGLMLWAVSIDIWGGGGCGWVPDEFIIAQVNAQESSSKGMHRYTYTYCMHDKADVQPCSRVHFLCRRRGKVGELSACNANNFC